MKNVLFLDDVDDRWEAFKSNLPSQYQAFRAKNAYEAIGLLSTETFDAVFLDHDLPDIHVSNGLSVAMFLAVCAHQFRELKIVIHSRNYYGNKSMCKVLPNAISWPGVWDFPAEIDRLLNN